ncbi:Retrovirus-related Pol polyprotein from transposon RE2 [Vitis vinifera]|uniref:Retrovirus-related Pol polyprotein from transposon RE2 n=1 Tax=Vitis vinifera TaxID=29760 RepID=A0A438IQB7_VITVI|nr:Retrovirus-related Pol polyprotein from transposon RE2 [Vitis vinifera]
MITSEKLVGSENYLSWSASVELWFMGQGYEDHLVKQEADILEVDRVQWRKIDAQLCSVLWQSVDPKILLHLRAYKTGFKFWNQEKGLYTNDIRRLYKVASSIVNVRQQDMDLSTYIGQIAFLKEEFLTVMPLTTDVGDQRTQIDKFFMVLTLIGLRPDLETVRDQILGSSSVPSLDDVFARLLLVTEVEANVLIAPIAISLATLVIGVINYMGGLPALPTWPSHLILSCLSFPVPPHLRVFPSLTVSMMTISAIRPPSQLLLLLLSRLDRSAGKTIGIGRESQGLYHLTSLSTPAVCISTNLPLLIHSRLGHPSLSKFQKMDKLSAKATKCLFLDIPDFKRVIGVIPLRLIATFSSLMFIISIIVFAVPPSLAEVPADSLPIPSTFPAPALPPTDLPIALRKVKVGLDDQVDCLKARLVAKGYTQVYGSDYDDTFSPFTKIASVCLLLSMGAMRSWPLYQLDIKNAFLHEDLAEEVYMEQPPGFVAQGESGLVCRLRRSLYGLKQSLRAWFSRFSSVVQEFGMFRNIADHSVFYHHNSSGQCIYLTKDLGKLKYFLGIEIAQSSSGVVLSQRKFALDILEETGQGVLYENRGHTQVVGYIDADWAGSPTDRRSTSGYCVFIGGNLISWKSKKQDVVAKSSAEAEYRAMTLATCELIWLKHLLWELRFGKDEQMKLICDN